MLIPINDYTSNLNPPPTFPRIISFSSMCDEHVVATEDLFSSLVDSDYNTFSNSIDGKRIPAVVAFANQCLVRSYERRSRCIDLTAPPSASYQSCTAPSNSINSSLESSSTSSPCTAHNMSLSTATSSAASCGTADEAIVRSAEQLLDDVEQPPSREEEIKRKLAMIKINYYRQKCMWSVQSFNKSMVHNNRLGAIRDGENDEVVPTADVVKVVLEKTTSTDFILSKMKVLFGVYTDVFSDVFALT